MVHFTQPFQLKGSTGLLEIKYSKAQAATARLLLSYIDPIKGREPTNFDAAYGFPLPTNGALVPLADIAEAHDRLSHEIALFDALLKTGRAKNLRTRMWVGANLLVEAFLSNDRRFFVLTQFEDASAPGSRQARFSLTPVEESLFIQSLHEISELATAFESFLECAEGAPPQTNFEPNAPKDSGVIGDKVSRPTSKRRGKKDTFAESPLPTWPVKITSGEEEG